MRHQEYHVGRPHNVRIKCNNQDKAALQRQLKRLELAEATLKADKASGKMAAESKDSEKMYKDKQAVKAEKKQITTDKK